MRAIVPFRQATDLESVRARLAAHFGPIDHDFLATHDADQALDYLERTHGVGSKPSVAAASSGALRMGGGVDNHVLRVLQRLGFVAPKAHLKTAHHAVMAAAGGLEPDAVFELHWHLKSLGQTLCASAKALCAACPLSDMCRHGVESLRALKGFRDNPGLAEASLRTPLGHGEADLCLKGGLQHGVLHEIFAAIGHEAAATGFVAGLAIRVAADKHALWIRQDFSTHEFGELSPTGLLELGLDPARLLLLSVSNAHDGLRAASDALSCAALGAVVIEIPGSPKILDLTASRRLTLAATQKSVTAFLLRLTAQPEASTAETRWLIRAGPSHIVNGDWGRPTFEASLIRNRHGNTGRWLMEWDCDGRIFQSSTADHGAVVSATAN